MKTSSVRTPRLAALAAIMGIGTAILVAPTASADVTGVTSTTTPAVAAGVSTVLSGMSVSVGDAEVVEVNVSTTSGTLSVDTSTGVSLAYGYVATGPEVAFRGSGAQVNAALAVLRLTAAPDDRGGSATVSITARSSDGYIYSSTNRHFYEYVAAPAISWTSARAAASVREYRGQQGYLATVPSPTVNDLISGKIPDALNVWLGGEGVLNTGGYGRVWSWVDGPLAGDAFSRCTSAVEREACDFIDNASFYHAWASGEPNNYDGGEPYVVTNWDGVRGQWNDLPDSAPAISGYVVEYGNLAYGSTSMTGIYSASSTVAINGVPGAPTGVSATPGVGQVSVAFSAPADDGGASIVGYRVTASPGGAAVDCAASPCVVAGLTGGTAYTFTVQAQNIYGWSASSAGASATAGAVPGTPTGLQAAFVVGAAPTSSVAATGYPTPTFSITGGALPAGVTLGTNGSLSGTPTTTGSWSVEITATNPYASAATTFSGTTGSVPLVASSSLGDLWWNTPVDTTLVATAVPGATWSVTGGSLPAGLTLSTTGRVTGTPTAVGAYSVTITATNSHGSDGQLFAGSVAPLLATAPTLTVVTPHDEKLTLAFTAPSSTGGSPVTGYEYSLNGGGTWVPAPLGVVTSPFDVTGLVNGTEYTVRVRAVTSAGGGAASNSVTGLPRTIPTEPTITSVASANSSLVVAFTVPSSSGGTPVLGYRYSLDGGTTWSTSLLSTTTSPLALYGLANGDTYQVALRAVSIAGDGAASAAVGGTPAVAPVHVPTDGGSALPELSPGSGVSLVNGSPVSVVSEPEGTGWLLTTPQVSLSINAYDRSAALVPTPEGSASFEALVGGYVLVQGQGFEPGSTADVWLFSTPVLIGAPTVASDGTLSAMLPIPAGIPAGQHTLQVNGITAGSQTVSASMGLRVATARSTLASTGTDMRLFPAALLVGLGVALLAAARGNRRWVRK